MKLPGVLTQVVPTPQLCVFSVHSLMSAKWMIMIIHMCTNTLHVHVSILYTIHVPEQVVPLPSLLYPDGHVQVKLPTVFIQVETPTQSAVPMVHSLMSEIEILSILSIGSSITTCCNLTVFQFPLLIVDYFE